MNELTINYKNGHMTFYVDRYFPCLVTVARKAYPLIRQYASAEDLLMLKKYLEDYEQDCITQISSYARKANEHEYGTSQYRYCKARIRELKVLKKRTKRNLEILMNGGIGNA